jgi:hypothetical protein
MNEHSNECEFKKYLWSISIQPDKVLVLGDEVQEILSGVMSFELM